MGFRIVKINNRCKLETQINYLVCRAEKETRILLDEISVLIIENQQVCITTALISELMNHQIRVMFCDAKHNPQGELAPYHASYNAYEKLVLQINWKKETTQNIWNQVVRLKINNQATLLQIFGHKEEADKLFEFREQVVGEDETNREGISSKIYFSTLFGKEFERKDSANPLNTYLNYGYSIILSAFNREVNCLGYLTQLGIHHIGKTNPFNLSCDFMEPFRPFVDEQVIKGGLTEENYKKNFMNLLMSEVKYNDKIMIMDNAIHFYVLALFSALNNNTELDAYPLFKK